MPLSAKITGSKRAIRRLNKLKRESSLLIIRSLAKGITQIFNDAATKQILPRRGGNLIRSKGGLLLTRRGSVDSTRLTGRTGKLKQILGDGNIKETHWRIPRSGKNATLPISTTGHIFARIKMSGSVGELSFDGKYGVRASGDKGVRNRLLHETGSFFGRDVPARPFMKPAQLANKFIYQRLFKRLSGKILNQQI